MNESEIESKKIMNKFPNIGDDCQDIFTNFPHLREDYIAKLLEEERNNPNEIDLRVPDKMKLDYLDLICKDHPELCTKILSLNNFPLDKSVEILEKYRAHEGLAFLYYQKKDYEACWKEYLKVNYRVKLGYKNVIDELC